MRAEQLALGVLIALCAGVAVVVTLAFRRSLLTMRYWLGWLAICVVIAAGGSFVLVLPASSRFVGISPIGWGGISAGLLLLALSIQLSISISGQSRMLVTLAQECAELRQRLDAFGHERGPTSGLPTAQVIQQRQTADGHEDRE